MTRFAVFVFLAVCTNVYASLSFGPEVQIDDHEDPTTSGIDIVHLQSGRFIVLWEGQSEPLEPYRAWCSSSDDFGSTWTNPVPVSDQSAVGASFPRFTSDSLDVVYAIWEDWRGPEAYAPYFSKSLDGGETWLVPNVQISNEGEVGVGPSIACNGDGSILVSVFNRLSENRVYSSYSLDGGLTWSTDTPVGDVTPTGQYYPVVENTGENSFCAVWKDERDTVSFLYGSLSFDGGQSWTNPNIAIPCGGHETFPHSISLQWDGSVLHAFWIESYTILNTTPTFSAYYSRSLDAGLTWLASPVRVDKGYANTQMHRGGLWARNPQNIFVVWCSMVNQSYPIYSVCSISSDSGNTWSDTLRTNPVGGEAGRCNVSGDNLTGELLVTWTNLLDQHIYCSHGYDMTGLEPEVSSPDLRVTANPFSRSVGIFSIGDIHPRTLHVYNFLGRRISTLDCLTPGNFVWTPSKNVPSGVYFIHGSTVQGSLLTKVILIKN